MIHYCNFCKRRLGKLRYILRFGKWNPSNGKVRWIRMCGYYCLDCANKLVGTDLETDILSERNDEKA